MPYIESNDDTPLYYRDWGTGAPVVFVSSWALHSAMWEYQMVPLSDQGLRCVAYDRRGHGRSDDPGRGYNFDTLADDLAAIIEKLNLREVTLVGHSMGSCEIARYLARHGTGRIARVALISPITPYILKTDDNPLGVPKAFLDAHIEAIAADRPQYFNNGAIKFFSLGATWPRPAPLSPEMIQWTLNIIAESSPKAIIECRRAFQQTDFRPDMAAFKLPTLIIHGDNDQTAPLEITGRRTAQAIPGSELVIYPGGSHGLFLTHIKRLNEDLLAFIKNTREN